MLAEWLNDYISKFFRKAKKAEETMNPYDNSDEGEVNKAFEQDIEQTGL